MRTGRQQKTEAEMVIQRRRGGGGGGGATEGGLPSSSSHQRESKDKQLPYGSSSPSRSPLHSLWCFFCFGVALGLVFVSLALVGIFFFSGSGTMQPQHLGHRLGNALMKYRELRAARQLTRDQNGEWPQQDIDVKGLPALLLESQRKEEVNKHPETEGPLLYRGGVSSCFKGGPFPSLSSDTTTGPLPGNPLRETQRGLSCMSRRGLFAGFFPWVLPFCRAP